MTVISDSAGRSWKHRAITVTKGNQSRLGCIIIAMIGLMPKHPPRIRPCTNLPNGTTIGGLLIDRHGMCIVDMELRNGKGFLATTIGDTEEIRDNLRGLADHLKLSDSERLDMFQCFQMFIMRDFRATSGPIQ